MIQPAQTLIRGGIETIFADLNTPNGIIMVVLFYKRSMDISVENSLLPEKQSFQHLTQIIRHTVHNA